MGIQERPLSSRLCANIRRYPMVTVSARYRRVQPAYTRTKMPKPTNSLLKIMVQGHTGGRLLGQNNSTAGFSKLLEE